MRRRNIVVALLLILAVPVAAFAAAATRPAAGKQRTTIGNITIVAGSLVGALQGPWTVTRGATEAVRITSDGTTLTADTVKIWMQKGGRNVQRVEATGNVHVTGTYAMASPGAAKADWKVNATASNATYDGGTQTAVMSGKVDLLATNASTGEVVTAKADKATYAGKTQEFQFEQAGEPVQVQWQQPTPKAGGQ